MAGRAAGRANTRGEQRSGNPVVVRVGQARGTRARALGATDHRAAARGARRHRAAGPRGQGARRRALPPAAGSPRIVRQTLPRLANLGLGSSQGYSVMATATDYLPGGHRQLPAPPARLGRHPAHRRRARARSCSSSTSSTCSARRWTRSTTPSYRADAEAIIVARRVPRGEVRPGLGRRRARARARPGPGPFGCTVAHRRPPAARRARASPAAPPPIGPAGMTYA